MLTEQAIRDIAADITKKYHDGLLLPRATVEGIRGLNALAKVYCNIDLNFEAPGEAVRLYLQTTGEQDQWNGREDDDDYEYDDEDDYDPDYE